MQCAYYRYCQRMEKSNAKQKKRRPTISLRLAPDAEILLSNMMENTMATRTRLINRAIVETYSGQVGKRALSHSFKAKAA